MAQAENKPNTIRFILQARRSEGLFLRSFNSAASFYFLHNPEISSYSLRKYKICPYAAHSLGRLSNGG